jgi:hypothetical protein
MTVPQNKLSDPFVTTDYMYPDDQPRTTLNEDWENGPLAVLDTSEGAQYQAWKITYEGGDFILTPQTTGPPVIALEGIDSIQCSFCFDQNANYTITWESADNQGHLYWYDTAEAQYVTTDFATPIWGLALTLDDKRRLQTGESDMVLWYTLPGPVPGQYILYSREQRTRFETAHEMQNPAWPYIHKCGMQEGMRVGLDLSTEPPA